MICEKRVKEEVKQSKFTNTICLAGERLFSFPDEIFNMEWVGKIRRLDLSYNNIRAIPESICKMTNLKELWLQGNPITSFPRGMGTLSHLEIIDVRNTKIVKFPPEMSTIPKLLHIDWRGTPAAEAYGSRYDVHANDLVGLKEIMSNTHRRQGLERKLFETLSEEHFVKEADKPGIGEFISNLVDTLSIMFNDLEEFRIFVKRVCNLLPEYTTEITNESLKRTKDDYYAMQRATHRKRLAADVEIKLRSVYFDRIEREDVENVINSIYEHVLSLEDIQFFVKYASQVLPPTPAGANGAVVWKNILDLQQELTSKRNAAIEGLTSVMTQLYPEQEPIVLSERAAEVAKYFAQERFATKRELTNLSRLTADASKLMPPDFASLDPLEVHTQVCSNAYSPLSFAT